MLDTCKQYADDVSLKFNVSKTKCRPIYFDYTGSTNIPNNNVFIHEHASQRKFLKMVQFGAYWRLFCKNFVKKIL